MVRISLERALSLGREHLQAGRLTAAELVCRAIVQSWPDEYEAYTLLGLIAQRTGHLNSAGAIDQAQAGECCSRAASLYAQGKLQEAESICRQSLALDPAFVDAYSGLGAILQAQGRLGEAETALRQALALAPSHFEACNNLAAVLGMQRRTEEAEAFCRRAIAIQPQTADAYSNLGMCLHAQGRAEEAWQQFRRALELNPGHATAHDNALLCEQYRAGTSPARLAAAHAEWEQWHAAPLRSTWRPHANDRHPERRLRLGFVSGDFRRHPVGFYLIRTFEALDREACDTVCYSHLATPDALTARFAAAAGAWRNVAGLSDAALAEQIRDDRIDILFDLAGHTGGNRLLALVRKPAPIQITWIGYEGTTGLAAMDYIIADRYLIPPGAEIHYRERVLRLPDCYTCYEPLPDAPPVGPLPALERGGVTFGSFNNLAKVTPEVVTLWAEILRRLPTARLLLKNQGFNDQCARRRYTEAFAAQGIAPQRLQLEGWSPHVMMLADYNRVDLALDPFPFQGGMTTCESLWMGIPVIILPGETFAGRHGLSLLSHVGLTETIARDRSEYVQLAVRLANDLPRVATLRAGLRERVARSPLCDGKRLAAQLRDLLRNVWRNYCGAVS